MKAVLLKPKNVRNAFYHLTGWVILFLNKIRHAVLGYTRPRAFSVHDVDQAVRYDLDVAKKFARALKDYAQTDLKGKTVLELGPGADLGIGVSLLAQKARGYFSLDVNRLADKAPAKLYEKLFQILKDAGLDLNQKEFEQYLQSALDNFIVRRDFSAAPLKGKGIDVVISHHSFEHFDNLEKLFTELDKVVESGGLFVAEVDLQTHTRWIRQADPLNIYRYSKATYRAFKFLGSPNRVRPAKYVELLEKHGWKDVQVLPAVKLDESYVKKVQNSLAGQYKKEKDMDVLAFVLLAKKK